MRLLGTFPHKLLMSRDRNAHFAFWVTFAHMFRTSRDRAWSSNCPNTRAHTLHLYASESVARSSECALHVLPVVGESSSRANKRHVVLQSNSGNSSMLERANCSSRMKITCMVREPCHPPLDVLSTIQPSSGMCVTIVFLVQLNPPFRDHFFTGHLVAIPAANFTKREGIRPKCKNNSVAQTQKRTIRVFKC